MSALRVSRVRQSQMRAAALTFALVCATALTGCSDDSVLPMSASEVEDFVTSSLTEAEDAVGVESVECESGLEEEPDDRTSCAVALDTGIRMDALEVFVVEDEYGELVPDFITGTDTDGMPGIDVFD
jgi:hypothetical protein